ncbi:hypothetical protein AGMMS49959_05810 [Planctomycetales bacterium]|nr:hypothetical protein AGMMS49959_05810 [Planctomycetales bacterium]
MKNHLPRRWLVLALFAAVAPAFGGEDLSAVAVVKEVFVAGGSLMWVLLLTSMVGLTFALERVCGLTLKKHLPRDLVAQVEAARARHDFDRALGVAQASATTLGRALTAILSRRGESRRELETAVQEELERALWDERRNIRPIGVAATLAPMLGLLGTVMGLIEAFRRAAESGMGNPSLFAGGIYQALYTTAFGLIIALFLLLIFHVLRGRVEKIMRLTEDRALAVIHRDFYESEPATVVAEPDGAEAA